MPTSSNLEIHYYFKDDSHTIDAIVQNKCEHEILGVLLETAKIFGKEILIEIEPPVNGGFTKWFKVLNKQENQSAPISTVLIVSFTTAILFTPLGKITEKVIDNVFEDKELVELEKLERKARIEKTNAETQEIKLRLKERIEAMNESHVIKKKKSNFYEHLDRYPKVKSISIEAQDSSKEISYVKRNVAKEEFKKYILVSDELPSIPVEEAEIEIISPVLKKRNYKWTGLYNNEPISFTMRSNEFKEMVQRGEIEFKNGSSINCLLNINRKINNEGEIQITNYEVERVNFYYENEKPVETLEGRVHKKKVERQKKQLKLDLEW